MGKFFSYLEKIDNSKNKIIKVVDKVVDKKIKKVNNMNENIAPDTRFPKEFQHFVKIIKLSENATESYNTIKRIKNIPFEVTYNFVKSFIGNSLQESVNVLYELVNNVSVNKFGDNVDNQINRASYILEGIPDINPIINDNINKSKGKIVFNKNKNVNREINHAVDLLM